MESKITVSNLGQCVTGFLKGQYSATVMSQEMAFTAEEKKIKSMPASVLRFMQMGSLVHVMYPVLTWYFRDGEGIRTLLLPEEKTDEK